MRKITLLLSILTLVSTSVFGQFMVVRGDCTPDFSGDADAARSYTPRRLASVNTSWDKDRTYRQLVILMSFSDTDFQMENPKEAYNRLFNEKGYYQRNGAGCMADYFRDQSGGLFNLQFDIFGPYQVSSKAQPYENPNENTRNYGKELMKEAIQKMIEENPETDFSVYDWNGDGKVNQVIYVYAGLGGNNGSTTYGYIWPHTSTFSTITTPDGTKISSYTASAEHWPTTSKASCGLGTICHEYIHALGLPDIYPTNGWTFSIVDEWDLMDGGNFTNYGWCPPNLSPLEKMLLGWLQPEELTEPTTVKDLKPLSQGGKAYIIKHTSNEYLLLENRQWEGWDFGLPGKGLVIYHVNYEASKWSTNKVNNTQNKPYYCLVNADNLNFDAWDHIIGNNNPWAKSPHLHNRHLSSSPYPWQTDSTETVNRELTDTSVPAAQMYNNNAEGSSMLSKPITNIQMSNDGLISFDFMGGAATGIKGISDLQHSQQATAASIIIDLSGRRVDRLRPGEIYIEKRKDGTTRKYYYQ